MRPAFFKLPDCYRGDQWDGIPTLSVVLNELPPADALASATMHFKQDRDDPAPVLSLSTSSEITIDDADQWEMSIAPQTLNLSKRKIRLGC